VKRPEENPNNWTIEEFYDKLQNHDWFHSMSDDCSAAGVEQRKKSARNEDVFQQLAIKKGGEFLQIFENYKKWVWTNSEKKGEKPTLSNPQPAPPSTQAAPQAAINLPGTQEALTEKHLTVQTPAAPPSTQVAPPREYDYEAFFGKTETHKFSMDEKTMPYLFILNTNMPWLQQSSDRFIPGAVAGDTILSLGDIHWKNGTPPNFMDRVPLQIIPVDYSHSIIEFEINKEFQIQKTVELHQSGRRRELFNSCSIELDGKKKHYILPNGHEIIDTAYHYVLVVDERMPGGCAGAIMKFVRSKMESFKTLNDQIAGHLQMKIGGQNVPVNPLAMVINVSGAFRTRQGDKNEKYEYWVWNFEFDRVLNLGDPKDVYLAMAAKRFLDEIRGGTAKPIDHTVDVETEGEEVYEPGSRDGDGDDSDGGAPAGTPF